MKKAIVTFFCFVVLFSILATSSVYAAPSFVIKGNGTEEEGIIPPTDNYYIYHTPYTEEGGFPNADFQKGLMYWTHSKKSTSPDAAVDLITEENGNKYVTLTASDKHDGIYSIRFADPRVKVGDKLAVMYEWRGEDPAFQIALNQHIMNKDESSVSMIRLSQDAGDVTNIHIATSENEWNVSMSNVNEVVKEPNLGNPTIYLSYIVQVKNDPTCNAQIDNLRVVKYNKETALIFDLDGNQLYDLNNLSTGDVSDKIDNDDFSGIDYNAKPDKLTANEKSTVNPTADEQQEESFIEKYLIWIIAAILVITATITVTIIIIME